MEQDLQHYTPIIEMANQLLAASMQKLESMVKVMAPVQGNLRLHRECDHAIHDEEDDSILSCVTFKSDPPSCFLVDIPNEHLAKDAVFNPNSMKWEYDLPGGVGINNADIILYVTARNDDDACVPGSTVVAWAGACVRDQYGRPVAGAINICPESLLTLDDSTWNMFQKVVFHELLHVLVFSQDNMAHFVDAEGHQIPLEHIIGEDTNGVRYVISPKVREFTREHFDCPSIHGAILEPRGGEGTSGNHWMLNWHSELMGPVIFNNIGYVSSITCALFEDSGHYIVDYTQCAEPWRFGYKAGCGFFLDECSTSDSNTEALVPLHPQFFCNENYNSGCSWDGMSLASCRIISDEVIPLNEQYTESVLNLEMCPFEEALYVPTSNDHLCPSQNALNRRCLRTEIANQEISFDQLSFIGIPFGMCYDVQCLDYNQMEQQWNALQIMVQSHEVIVTCHRSEVFMSKTYSMNGQLHSITCPMIDVYCTTPFPFECLHGHRENEGESCICKPGWNGDQCTEQSAFMQNLAPNELLGDEYQVPGLRANILMINRNDIAPTVKRMVIQPSLLNGGYWYKTVENDADHYQMMWYDILLRSWVMATVNSVGTAETELNVLAICKTKMSLDVPDVVMQCDGKWMSLPEDTSEILDIEMMECQSCSVPYYFYALRNEIFE